MSKISFGFRTKNRYVRSLGNGNRHVCHYLHRGTSGVKYRWRRCVPLSWTPPKMAIIPQDPFIAGRSGRTDPRTHRRVWSAIEKVGLKHTIGGGEIGVLRNQRNCLLRLFCAFAERSPFWTKRRLRSIWILTR